MLAEFCNRKTNTPSLQGGGQGVGFPLIFSWVKLLLHLVMCINMISIINKSQIFMIYLFNSYSLS
jgi:hypothetical protein